MADSRRPSRRYDRLERLRPQTSHLSHGTEHPLLGAVLVLIPLRGGLKSEAGRDGLREVGQHPAAPLALNKIPAERIDQNGPQPRPGTLTFATPSPPSNPPRMAGEGAVRQLLDWVRSVWYLEVHHLIVPRRPESRFPPPPSVAGWRVREGVANKNAPLAPN